MNVKELKEIISNLSDDVEIMIEYDKNGDLIEEDILSAETGFLVDDKGEYLTLFLKF